jgi:hypothetical protein
MKRPRSDSDAVLELVRLVMTAATTTDETVREEAKRKIEELSEEAP